ncbi:trafficking PGA2 domain-containing [Fusarium albosuccineum]|uniref:Trafficking PGA2 domain-containing n=1 Tax=Fusarium albosuccineum TaxID=1237068 RepID=A0A8H4PCL8_9HYPO|nr:trafficking PGA2 domain-containing [Fusarium albosuccineum]
MDPVAQQQQEPVEQDQVELNALGKVTAQFLQYGANASNNLSNTFNNMTMQSWIRLVVIVGGYMLLRPYMMKFVTKGAVRKMEEEDEKEKRKAQISPNELRGLIEEEPEIDEEGDGTGADWGQKARVRQRTMLKDLLEAEERRREEEEEDKDIADLLED